MQALVDMNEDHVCESALLDWSEVLPLSTALPTWVAHPKSISVDGSAGSKFAVHKVNFASRPPSCRPDLDMKLQRRVAKYRHDREASEFYTKVFETTMATKLHHLLMVHILLSEVMNFHESRGNPPQRQDLRAYYSRVESMFFNDEEDPYSEVLPWLARKALWNSGESGK